MSVDTRIADRRAATEYGETLRQRAAVILQLGHAELLATDAGKAALNAVVDALLGLRNAWSAFEATQGSIEAAGALAWAAIGYQKARLALATAIDCEVARRMGTDDPRPAA